MTAHFYHGLGCMLVERVKRCLRSDRRPEPERPTAHGRRGEDYPARVQKLTATDALCAHEWVPFSITWPSRSAPTGDSSNQVRRARSSTRWIIEQAQTTSGKSLDRSYGARDF